MRIRLISWLATALDRWIGSCAQSRKKHLRHPPDVPADWSTYCVSRGPGLAGQGRAGHGHGRGRSDASPPTSRTREQHRPRLSPVGRRRPAATSPRSATAPMRSRASWHGSAKISRSRSARRACGRSCLSPAGYCSSAMAVQQAYWSGTRRGASMCWRPRSTRSNQRLDVVGQRLAYNLLWLPSFAMGSLGAPAPVQLAALSQDGADARSS